MSTVLLPPSWPEPTLGFVCPLYLEFWALCAIFDQSSGEETVGELTFCYGRIGNHYTVAVSFPDKQIGPVYAARYASALRYKHQSLTQPGSHCFLVGIAAGLWSNSHDVRLGDVVIATKVWDYSGKQEDIGSN